MYFCYMYTVHTCIHNTCTYISFISHLCSRLSLPFLPFSPPSPSPPPSIFPSLLPPSLSTSLPLSPLSPPSILPSLLLSLPLSLSLSLSSLSSPIDELLFRGPSGQELLCNVVLTNTTDAIVAYKVPPFTYTHSGFGMNLYVKF